MEDISPIYENVSIESWSQGIRLIKIRELEELLIQKGNAIRDTDFTKEDYMSPRRINLLSDISRIKRKLDIIKK